MTFGRRFEAEVVVVVIDTAVGVGVNLQIVKIFLEPR